MTLSFPDYTLHQILTNEAGTARAAALAFTYAQCHEDREAAIRRLLDFCCNEFEKNRHLKAETDKSEDELTIEIVSQMHLLGIDASHDKQQGGHCDILVEGREGFCWILEAKKHTSYAWLEKGFLQLATRYSTGVYGQDSGDVLVYCWNKSSKDVLESWRVELKRVIPEVAVDEVVCDKTLTFNSKHKHENTSRDFRVRHKIVSLYFQPRA